jgi:hypothetical protein
LKLSIFIYLNLKCEENMKKIDFSCIQKVTEDFGRNPDPEVRRLDSLHSTLASRVPTKPKIILKTFLSTLAGGGPGAGLHDRGREAK